MVALKILLLTLLNVCLTWGKEQIYDTYICEEEKLSTLSCPANTRIKVMKVLYGRQRMDQCNTHRKSLPNDCYSQLATSYVIRQCNSSMRECSFATVKLFDQGDQVKRELKNNVKCFPPGANNDVTSITFQCEDPKPTISPPKKKGKTWHLKTIPRDTDFEVYEGETVNLTCRLQMTITKAGFDIRNDVTIRWADNTAGNNIYSSNADPNGKDTPQYGVVNQYSSMDVVASTLTIKKIRRPEGRGSIRYGCDFRKNTDKNNPLIGNFELSILPATTTTTTLAPTTTTTTTSYRCDEAKRKGVDLCSLHAICSDHITSYRCQCDDGYEGGGHVFGACQKVRAALRGEWVCPAVAASRANDGCIAKALLKMQKSFKGKDLDAQLTDVTSITKENTFSGGELVILSDVLNTMLKGFDEQSDINFRRMTEKPDAVSKVVVNTTSKLITRKRPWMDQPAQTRRNLAMNFTRIVEETCLATTRNTGSLTIEDPMIDVKVVEIRRDDKPIEFRPGRGRDRIQLFTKEDPAMKERGLYSVPPTGTDRVVFVRYKGIRDFLGKNADDSEKEKKENDTRPEIVVFSDVISAKMSVPARLTKIKLNLTHDLSPNASVATRRCAFWNYNNESWDFTGCRLLNSSRSSFSVCECDHLTSFAILLDYSGASTRLSESHRLSLSIITYIGCILSIFCCIFGVWTYDILRRSKGDRMNSEGRTSFIIYEMICLSLLFAQTIFLMGIYHTKDMILCKIVAAALHYFFLLLFEWMLMAGVYYILVYTQPYSIVTLDSHRCVVMIGLLLIPAVIVGISLGIRLQGYGTKDHCWLSVADGLIWAFVGPVTVMLSVNMILLSILIVLTWKIKPSDMLESGEVNKGWVTSRARKLRYELLFCIVLGATWIFGYLLIENTSSLVFSYIFAILNSLQGVFILISYANWSRIRAAYIAEFRRKRWLPESFRRWLHSRQYSPGGPPGVGMVGSSASATASQRTRSGRGSGSHRGLLSGTVNAHASVSSGALSHTTRTTRLGSGSSGAKWSVSAGGMRGIMDANENSVAMVTETEGAYNENYAGHSMMDEPRQVFSDFDDSEFESKRCGD